MRKLVYNNNNGVSIEMDFGWIIDVCALLFSGLFAN